MLNQLITPIIWSDLNPNLIADAQAKLKLDVNIDAVRGSIDNIVRTSPGERVFLPEFALGLKNLLFEPLTNRLLDRFSDDIKNKIEIWDPRVSVVGVDYQLSPDNNLIALTVRFSIQGFVQTFSTIITV